MSAHRQLELEEDYLDEQYAAGTITSAEYAKELRELQRDYRAAAEEAAQDAYETELRYW
jgi:hypothetical protein